MSVKCPDSSCLFAPGSFMLFCYGNNGGSISVLSIVDEITNIWYETLSDITQEK